MKNYVIYYIDKGRVSQLCSDTSYKRLMGKLGDYIRAGWHINNYHIVIENRD